MLTHKTKGQNKFELFFTEELNGGGMGFGAEYPEIIRKLYPNKIFNHCLDWCSGPGFIGLEILDQGLCKELSLVDIYQPAIDHAQHTITHNNLQNSVTTYCTGDIVTLPNVKFDLVVSNPPHYNYDGEHPTKRIRDDANWDIHRNFYNKIGNFLTDDAVIIMQENMHGSTVDDFREMIESNNLKINNVIDSPNYFNEAPLLIYYIEVHKNNGV